jgi:hypothetical protein
MFVPSSLTADILASMHDNDYWVMKALAKILIRKGVIDDNDIRDAAEGLKRVGFETAAHNLTMIALEAHSVTASEFEADFRRRQMIERTAMINRKDDDGKPSA